jgi:hypothetical protein
MRPFMQFVIGAVFLCAYLSTGVQLLPSAVKFVPDVCSILIAAYVIVEGARRKFRNVDPKYWILLGALAFSLVCGPLVNQEAPGPIVSGLRYYARAMPLFLLPAVVDFSDRDLKSFMLTILGFSLLQVPVAAYQKYTFISHGWWTGDGVFGTLMISGILSVFLISVLCVMAALTIRGFVDKKIFFFSFLLLVIPMSINETKATFLLLPIGLLLTFLVASPRGRRLIVLGQALIVLTVAGAVLVPTYNHFNKRDDGGKSFTVEEFFTQDKMLDEYLTKGAGVGSGKEAGRLDALRAPFVGLQDEPLKLFFGLGMGNASKSSLGSQFEGRYRSVYWNFMQASSVSGFLVELGLFGTALILMLHIAVLRDCIFVGRHDEGLRSAISAGMVGVLVVVTLGLFYTMTHTYESVSYMFWLFAGIVAARRRQLVSQRVRARQRTRLPLATAGARAG